MKRLLFVVALAGVSTQAFSWGFDGHRRLVKLMQAPLPSNTCLHQFISTQQSPDFQDAAADPDRWREPSNPSYDASEGVRHYLEIDYAQPISSYPREWEAVKLRFGRNAENNGLVPWRVEEFYALLVQAFSSKDVSKIKDTLAHASHYITDSFSVLHNTKNYDPNGLHSRWESDMLNSSSRIDALSTQAQTYFGTVGRVAPRLDVFDVVEVGNGLLAPLIAADVGTPNDMTAFFAAVRDLTARRWGDALTFQASFVASAWVDAGSPMLPGMSNSCVKDVPQGNLVLKGYPLPARPTDLPDAGSDVADAGREPVNPPTPESPPTSSSSPDAPTDAPVGCQCGHISASQMVWALGLTAWALRRRKSSFSSMK